MSTWHQDRRNPAVLWHPTKFTVVTDAPGMPMTLGRFDTIDDAEKFAKQTKHSYILPPGPTLPGGVF